jgi:hypothetical protein
MYGSILNKPRNLLVNNFSFFKDLFKCSLCLGFWSGVFIAYASYQIDANKHYYYIPLSSSAVCWMFDSLLDLIQLSANKLDQKK